jgi:predicted NAD/FAD-binding protein
MTTRKRIAVIGAGISGLGSAYFLSRHHDVVLYEAGSYLGGHANTVFISLEGYHCAVDTGFLVYNKRTYPNFVRLLNELDVQSVASDMSFGVSMDNGRLEWAGTNLDTVFTQRSRLLSPSFLRMLRDILHFNRHATRFLALSSANDMTLGELLDSQRYGKLFRHAYLLPMAAAIWSSSARDILAFPAATFIRFCLNHALLQVNDRPKWHTVRGGSRNYVQAIAAQLPECRLRSPVRSVRRDNGALIVTTDTTQDVYDDVVFATHTPSTLSMISDATDEERTILGKARYQPNIAYLHTDVNLMPRNKKVWSAWNYLSSKAADDDQPVCVTYWLNQLQDLPISTPILVTLNPPEAPAAGTILAKFDYDHPVMDQAMITAQKQLPDIQGKDGLWYAGAWTGFGFHEDGLKSALRIAAAFGAAPDWATLS